MEINKMGRRHLNDVRTLSVPPKPVKDVLTAALLILGHYPEETEDFSTVRRLFGISGPESALERMKRLDPNSVSLDVALGARSIVKDLTYDMVHEKCLGAAPFVQWNQCVIQAVLSRYTEEEIANTQPRTTRPREPEDTEELSTEHDPQANKQ